jgi:hypothetical protein
MGRKARVLAISIGMALALASHAALAARPLSLAIGQQVRGEITSADTLNVSDGTRSELYAIDLDAGQAVGFEVTGALRATLSLFNDDTLVARTAADGDSASLSVRAPRKGRYLLAVSGRNADAYGPYLLASNVLKVYDGSPVAIGQTIHDWSDSARSLPLHITSEGLYVLRMVSADFDTVLSLEGNGVALNNDDADGSDSRITTHLQPGDYVIKADGYDGRMSGKYSLTVESKPLPAGVVIATAGTLQPGQPVRALYVGTPVEYSLVVPSRQLLRLDMESSEFDSLLELGGQGIELSDDDSGERLNARIVSLLEPGTYTVQVKANGQDTGVFTLKADLSAAPADAGGGTLVVGQPRSARLLGNSVVTYQLRIPRNGDYVIDMQSDDIDSTLRLLRDGQTLAEDDDGGDGLNARIQTQLTAGTYTVQARSLGGGGGSDGRYTISVRAR